MHTFRLVNAEGRSTFVTFHWKPKRGPQSVVWDEAVKINGADPDFHRRDLWDAITQGDFPEWELGLQLFDDDFADQFAFDVLDPTKIIPEEELPVRRVGRLVLDRVVDNFFAETEQVAFVIGCPLASRSLMERAPAGFPPAVPRRRMAIWKAHRPGKATRAPRDRTEPGPSQRALDHLDRPGPGCREPLQRAPRTVTRPAGRLTCREPGPGARLRRTPRQPSRRTRAGRRVRGWSPGPGR